jgi:hypothetical protein
MSVYQVEEYYIHMSGLKVSAPQKEAIEELLNDEGFSNYEFQDNDTVLVVDDITSESDGDTLESEIESILDT